MAVVYVLMYFKCKICFTVYTGETKINDTYLLHICTQKSVCAINFGPFGEIGANFPVQLSSDHILLTLKIKKSYGRKSM